MFIRQITSYISLIVLALLVIPVALTALFINNLYFYDPYAYLLQASGNVYLYYKHSITDVPFQGLLKIAILISRSTDILTIGKLYGAFLFGLMLNAIFLTIYLTTRSIIVSFIVVILVFSNPTISLFGIMPYREAFGTLVYVLSLMFIFTAFKFKINILSLFSSVFFIIAIITRPELLVYTGALNFVFTIWLLINSNFKYVIRIKYLLLIIITLNYICLTLLYVGQIILFGSIFPYFSNPGYIQRVFNSLYNFQNYRMILELLFDDFLILSQYFAPSYLVNFLLTISLVISNIILGRKDNRSVQNIFAIIAPMSIIHGLTLVYARLPSPRLMILPKVLIYLSFGILIGRFASALNNRFKSRMVCIKYWEKRANPKVITKFSVKNLMKIFIILLIVILVIPRANFSIESIANASDCLGVYNDVLKILINSGLDDSVILVPMYPVFRLTAPKEIQDNLVSYLDIWSKAGMAFDINAPERERATVAQFLREELINNTKIRYIVIDNVDDSINMLLPYMNWNGLYIKKLAVYTRLYKPWRWRIIVEVFEILARYPEWT
ncbi:MAG: hypothetical protein QXF82_04445, partial [Nitrososphaeria archaeon]